MLQAVLPDKTPGIAFILSDLRFIQTLLLSSIIIIRDENGFRCNRYLRRYVVFAMRDMTHVTIYINGIVF